MTELVKIREVSIKYDISARALRYYEDMGLIKVQEALIMHIDYMISKPLSVWNKF